MKIKSLRRLRNFSNRTFLLRVDFNVPLVNGKIKEDYKIQAALETLRFLLKRRAKIIIISHLGEPSGPSVALSLSPVAKRLAKLLGRPVKFLSGSVLENKTQLALTKLGSGEVVMLENIRFYKGEYTNDSKFAKQLAALADIYINDAFAVSHREQASVSGVADYLPAYAGLLLEKELRAMAKIIKPQKPLVVIMGGAKIKTKLPLIMRLKNQSSQILIGGGLANTFFKFQGLTVGRSLYDKNGKSEFRELSKNSRLNKKIILPRDVVIKDRTNRAKVVVPSAVKSTDTILDIGPKTIAEFASYIKRAKTLVWNGPLGFFEDRRFKHGTMAVAMLLAARSSGRAYGLVGGGETVEALKQSKMANYVDWISTGGGATLAYLGGIKLPGLKKIVSK